MSSNISFALNLQSEVGQKAIMVRLDSELRILENLRKFLNAQIRAGREYSTALVNATGAAIKALTVEGGSTGGSGVIPEGNAQCNNTQTTPLVGSSCNNRSSSPSNVTDGVVSQVCLHVLEEVQSTAVNIKENSDFLHSQTLKQLSELIAEKKLLVKGSHEEYARIKGRLDQLTELVNKCKAEYMKTHIAYELARTKYEDQCAAAVSSTGSFKGTTGKPGNETGKEKDKFFRAKRRLNLAHTEYLLALQETTEYERDFRTVLLPGLLQVEQTWCEKEIGNWSEILEQIWNNGPSILSSIAKKLKDFEFSKEYLELISQYKCQPLQPTNLKFEPANTSTQPISQPHIIVDSSTIDFLKSRLIDAEKRLKISDAQLTEKTEQHIKFGSTLSGDLKFCEVSQARCEVERLHSLKNYLDSHLKNVSVVQDGGQTPTLQRALAETVSLTSEGGVSQKKGQGAGNRLTTFFRTAAARTRKAVSFDEDSSSPLIPILSNNKCVASSTISPIMPIAENEIPTVIVDRNMTSLLEQDWFHGVLPREDVVRLLRLQGDFLVRETVKHEERQIVLSVYWNGPKHFIVQTTPNGQFRFEGPFYPTVKELIDHYVKVKLPITNRSGAVIKKSVKRENWELNNDDVQLIEKIGRGNFGDVYKALYNGTLVAVKTCKVNLPEEHKKKFLQEGRILKQYDHINIVRFVGICVQKQPIMIVMEIVSGGSLLTYLKNKVSVLTVKQTTKLCLDAAAGMKYLEDKGCIHRDLAARNCLIDETTTVKISDFGMSREEHEYTVSDGMKQIPIKWTAPEALNYGKYTSLSDVWSYGILMWEIFAHGATPYSGMTNTRAREMIEAGYRMPATDGMPDVIYQLMTRCWQYEPEQRPRFSEIHSELEVVSVSDLI